MRGACSNCNWSRAARKARSCWPVILYGFIWKANQLELDWKWPDAHGLSLFWLPSTYCMPWATAMRCYIPLTWSASYIHDGCSRVVFLLHKHKYELVHVEPMVCVVAAWYSEDDGQATPFVKAVPEVWYPSQCECLIYYRSHSSGQVYDTLALLAVICLL